MLQIRKAKAKKYLFKLLNLLPASIGFFAYHKIQNLFENKSLSQKLTNGEDTFNAFRRLAKKIELRTEGKTVLEIGSGWLPILPYFFLYIGKAQQVLTFDLNKHFQKKNIFAFNKVFENGTGHRIKSNADLYFLPDQVKYFPLVTVSNQSINGVDIVFSRFVLEHVTPQAMEEMHQHFKEQLSPGANIIHFISPSDHRAYDDASLSLQDFLRYSSEEWDKIQTRFDYHNRWRLPQYVDLFKKLGFEIVHLEYDCPDKHSEAYRKFKAIQLHSDYQKFTEEELTAGSINIVLKV